jgi:hypothetical protein
MDIRLPQPKAAAKILKAALAQMGHAVKHTEALELVAKTYGYNDYFSMDKDLKSRFEEPMTLKAVSSDEYELNSIKGSGAWIGVNNISVRLFVDESGVLVKLYPKGDEMADELGSAQADFDEVIDRDKPDPTQPFHSCQLPYEFSAVEFVSSDARALDWSKRCSVVEVNNSLIQWLNEETITNDADLGEDFLSYTDGAALETLDAQALWDAKLQSDGRFELKDGRELYLIDANNQRWMPLKRI